jgi:hypothetical protein
VSGVELDAVVLAGLLTALQEKEPHLLGPMRLNSIVSNAVADWNSRDGLNPITRGILADSLCMYGHTAALSRRVAELEGALQPLAGIPLEEFGYGDHRPEQPITGWNKHTLYVRDVLAARAALKGQG